MLISPNIVEEMSRFDKLALTNVRLIHVTNLLAQQDINNIIKFQNLYILYKLKIP